MPIDFSMPQNWTLCLLVCQAWASQFAGTRMASSPDSSVYQSTREHVTETTTNWLKSPLQMPRPAQGYSLVVLFSC